MIVPVQNIVETVDLTPQDSLLPIQETVVNSIISLLQSNIPLKDQEIQVKIVRGALPTQTNISNIPTIHTVTITDNGVGFTEANFKSFETPFSKINKDYGCKGVGRFTVLAAFKSMRIRSNYIENNVWKYREFTFDADSEVKTTQYQNSDSKSSSTSTELIDCFNPLIKD